MFPPNWKGYVYCLKDPRDSAVRYVGQTDNAERRRLQHEENLFAGNEKKYRWVRQLRLLDLKPVFEVLETCELNRLSEREAHWVRVLTEQGATLLNRPAGRIGRDDLVATEDLESIRERIEVIQDELARLHQRLATTFGQNCLESVTLGKAAEVLNGTKAGIGMRLERKRGVLLPTTNE